MIPAADIPAVHSSTKARGPRFATSLPHAPVSDVTSIPSHRRGRSSGREPVSIRVSEKDIDNLDSKTISSGSSIKSRSHLRLASFGRIRSRTSVNQQQPQQAPGKGETKPAKVPISPLDAGSHKRSDTSTLSLSSSGTNSSETERRTVKRQPSRPSFWLASSNVSGDFIKENGDGRDGEHLDRLVPPKPHMMHQTSSKLLRMTDDERPFTRVRTVFHVT